jgi:hypothetical protein
MKREDIFLKLGVRKKYWEKNIDAIRKEMDQDQD